MPIDISTAIRTRWCNECHQEIPPGATHLRYGSISLNKNVCSKCIRILVATIDYKNKEGRHNDYNKIGS